MFLQPVKRGVSALVATLAFVCATGAVAVAATQIGTDGPDKLSGTVAPDQLYGEAGDDQLLGFASNDYLEGGPGKDDVEGADGIDLIIAGTGDDGVDAGSGNDVVYAGAGADLVLGGPGGDTLFGQADADRLFGGSGNDSIYASSGQDFVERDVSEIGGFRDRPGDLLLADAAPRIAAVPDVEADGCERRLREEDAEKAAGVRLHRSRERAPSAWKAE